MVNAQQWLDRKYPQEIRAKVKELNISDKNLEGFLDLTEFVNLEELECYNNQLSSLDLSGLGELRILDCSDNNLTNLTLSNCTSITYLNAYNNRSFFFRQQKSNLYLP